MPTVHLHTNAKDHDWSDVEVPFVVAIHMPLAALAEALDALSWRTVDLQALVGRNIADALERQAKRAGKKYDGPVANLTGKDEVLTDQLSVFGSLRAAGYSIPWSQACGLSRAEFTIASTAEEVARTMGAAEEPAKDPQVPSADSAQAVDGASIEGGAAAQTTGPQ